MINFRGPYWNGMSAPRYEFRTFGPDLGTVGARLREMAPLGRYRESRELYLLLPGRLDLNLKVRDDALELKRRVELDDDLELWRPAFRLAFPIPATTLREHLADLLPESATLPDTGSCDARRLLALLTAPRTGVARASLFKQRFGFDIAGCLAEVVEVLVNGARLMSAAVEAEDPARVRAQRDRLGLAGTENVGYVLALERVLGRLPLPPGAFYDATPG